MLIATMATLTLGRPGLALALVLAGSLGGSIVGCGARSAFTDDGGDTDGGGDDPERLGSCDMPITLPFAPQTVRGRLVGGGSAEGWCGEADGGDRGREDTYVLTPPYSTDVILTLRDGTDFPAMLRVTPDTCREREGVLPEICVVPEIDEAWHFWAEAGHDYNISVDSPAGTDGRYELEVTIGWPPLEACDIHPTAITYEPGGYFLWENDLAAGQGRVDGACGGPGRENMFRLVVTQPTYFAAQVTYNDMTPVVNLRTSCAAASEIICDTREAGSGQIFLEYFFDAPGEYYLVVDQGDVRGGNYVLEIYWG